MGMRAQPLAAPQGNRRQPVARNISNNPPVAVNRPHYNPDFQRFPNPTAPYGNARAHGPHVQMIYEQQPNTQRYRQQYHRLYNPYSNFQAADNASMTTGRRANVHNNINAQNPHTGVNSYARANGQQQQQHHHPRRRYY
ncbi:hypothetical protein TWF718_008854 [Orbilia javanica]|uniref:Uncharacterized protein n=1 Tax=Orbilia javanica TaxID=47235 RepID=A0AAN8RGI7_9PEZI